jgi:hypothetical protein
MLILFSAKQYLKEKKKKKKKKKKKTKRIKKKHTLLTGVQKKTI